MCQTETDSESDLVRRGAECFKMWEHAAVTAFKMFPKWEQMRFGGGG